MISHTELCQLGVGFRSCEIWRNECNWGTLIFTSEFRKKTVKARSRRTKMGMNWKRKRCYLLRVCSSWVNAKWSLSPLNYVKKPQTFLPFSLVECAYGWKAQTIFNRHRFSVIISVSLFVNKALVNAMSSSLMRQQLVVVIIVSSIIIVRKDQVFRFCSRSVWISS